jgi:diacylglycerol kinase (ATP)
MHEEAPSVERVLLILNRASGSAGDVDEASLIAALGGDSRVTAISPEAGDLDHEVSEAADGADLIVVAGGDGTLHAVVHALGDLVHHVGLGVIPMGTGNDFATTVGMPDDPLDAAHALSSGRDRAIDVALAEGDDGVRRRFLNASIGGFPVAVDDAVSDRLKRSVGAAAYTIAGAKVATDLPRFTVTIGDRVVEDCVAAGVGNGRTVGGGIPMWPDADPSDGLLDGCAVPASGVVDAMRLGARVRGGRHDELADVVTLQAPEIRVESEPEMEMNVDGELVGIYTPVTFRIDGTVTMRVPV